MSSRQVAFVRAFSLTILWGVFTGAIGGALYGGVLSPLYFAASGGESTPFLARLLLSAMAGSVVGVFGAVIDGILLGWLTTTYLAAPHLSTQKRWALRAASVFGAMLAIVIFLMQFVFTPSAYVPNRLDVVFVFVSFMSMAGIGGWIAAERVIAAGQIKRKKNDGTRVEKSQSVDVQESDPAEQTVTGAMSATKAARRQNLGS